MTPTRRTTAMAKSVNVNLVHALPPLPKDYRWHVEDDPQSTGMVWVTLEVKRKYWLGSRWDYVRGVGIHGGLRGWPREIRILAEKILAEFEGRLTEPRVSSVLGVTDV